MHKDVPKWFPHFKCYNKRCAKWPCLINDACWLTLSILLIALLTANGQDYYFTK